MILAVRTDAPEAHLRLYDADKLVESITWQAHRALAETITTNITQLMERVGAKYKDLECIAVFVGPGSFTGLRIGVSVANALGYSVDVPVVGVDERHWNELPSLPTQDEPLVLPVYGSEPHITQPKK